MNDNDNPFSREYAESCYEQLQTVEQEVIEDIERPQLVTFRLTGRPNSTEGNDDSDYLDRLMLSAPAITDALNHITDGWDDVRWSVIAEEGDIPVWYLNVYVNSDLGRYDFMRVIHRHVSHSPVAFRQDHDLDDSITIRNIGGSNPLAESETLLPLRKVNSIAGSEAVADVPTGTYVMSNLLGFEDETEDSERLQRTISASDVDSQFLPGETFEKVLSEAQSVW
jgi:hypothetical protein